MQTWRSLHEELSQPTSFKLLHSILEPMNMIFLPRLSSDWEEAGKEVGRTGLDRLFGLGMFMRDGIGVGAATEEHGL